MSYPCVRTRIANDSDFPTSFVRAAFNFCLPAGVTKIDVVFLEPVATGTGESSGECWLNGVERNNFQRPFIYVAVSKADRFPSPPQRTAWKEGYLPEPYFASREEMAIYILVHELRHVWQWRVHNLISQHDAERDACAYGIHILRRWRRIGSSEQSLHARCIVFSPEEKTAADPVAFHPGELSAQATFRGPKSDDRGKLRTVSAPRRAIGVVTVRKFGAFGQARYTE